MPDGRDKYREVRTARQFEDQMNTGKCMATCALLAIYASECCAAPNILQRDRCWQPSAERARPSDRITSDCVEAARLSIHIIQHPDAAGLFGHGHHEFVIGERKPHRRYPTRNH
jgi:hypothetical protein